jgi:hypothetical protein
VLNSRRAHTEVSSQPGIALDRYGYSASSESKLPQAIPRA